MSSLRALHANLQHYKEDKWGLLVYRTAYTPASDSAWERFKTVLAAQTADELASPEATADVIRACDWTCISDAATLDGASRQQLRDRFRVWRESAAKAENPRRTIGNEPLAQRYQYFVQVDEESLRSVVEGGEEGWVHLVRAYERLDYENDGGQGDDEDDGWMMIKMGMLHSEFYQAIGVTSEHWYSFYQAPPSVVDW
ncbi:hypothetical protein OQA88_2392 [Cercophora sp. LCS_1]